MHHFEYRNGEMFAEAVPLKKIAKEVGTPAYVYSLATLKRHFRVFDQAFAAVPHIVCFSVKANSNIALLKAFAKEGVTGGLRLGVLGGGRSRPRRIFKGIG
jgi:diaminopimelate decarboxylase